MKTIKRLHLKGKTVLLRSDLNSDVVEGRVQNGPRIREAAETIRLLKRKGARVVIISHQGNEGKKDFVSLRGHARLLNKYTPVAFINDIAGGIATQAIRNLRDAEALLLENIRFEPDETKNPKKHNLLIERLAPLVDIYVNDAFSVSHRDHTSITGFPKVLPSYAGPLMEKELRALKKINLKHALFILGGGKPETNAKLLGKGATIIGTGYFGQLILLSRGVNLGYQNEYLQKDALVKGDWKSLLTKLRLRGKRVLTPVDFALNINGKRTEKPLEAFPQPYQIDDIGEQSIIRFTQEIMKAKTIYMKGPAGYASNKKFALGTVSLLKAIAASKAYSIVGGGHLSEAIETYHLPKEKYGHVSLSGGALLNFLAGEKLPGLEALKK